MSLFYRDYDQIDWALRNLGETILEESRRRRGYAAARGRYFLGEEQTADVGKIVTKRARLRWGESELRIEELPRPGKLKLHVAVMHLPPVMSLKDPELAAFFAPTALVRQIKVDGKTGFEKLKERIWVAYQLACDDYAEKTGQDVKPFRRVRWTDSVVDAGLVPPENQGPLNIQAKDFFVIATPSDFAVYQKGSKKTPAFAPVYLRITDSEKAGQLYSVLSLKPHLVTGRDLQGFSSWLIKNDFPAELAGTIDTGDDSGV